MKNQPNQLPQNYFINKVENCKNKKMINIKIFKN